MLFNKKKTQWKGKNMRLKVNKMKMWEKSVEMVMGRMAGEGKKKSCFERKMFPVLSCDDEQPLK